MAKTWVKLHVKILDSFDLAQLPDHTWRRAIELLSLAGREDREGALPDIGRIAWTFRISQDQLLQDLRELQNIGFVTLDPAGDWTITNWIAYQTTSDPNVSDRVKRYRQRQQADDVTLHVTLQTPVTPTVTPVTCNVLEENRIDTEEEIEAEAEERDGAAAPPAPQPAITSEPVILGKPKDGSSKADPRTGSPEIQLFKTITGKYPHKTNYDQVISAAQGKTLDELRPFYAAWCGKGYNPQAVTWLTEWAASGSIPGPPARAAPGPPGESVADKLRYAFEQSDRRYANGKSR